MRVGADQARPRPSEWRTCTPRWLDGQYTLYAATEDSPREAIASPSRLASCATCKGVGSRSPVCNKAMSQIDRRVALVAIL